LKEGNSRKANITLGLTAVGYFLIYPFQQSFRGGTLTSGFGAAMIGGFTDWGLV